MPADESQKPTHTIEMSPGTIVAQSSTRLRSSSTRHKTVHGQSSSFQFSISCVVVMKNDPRWGFSDKISFKRRTAGERGASANSDA
jgi:hypothetical protein